MKFEKIIITGGATRIGAAIAAKLSGQSVEMVVHYNKSKKHAENLKKKLLAVMRISMKATSSTNLFFLKMEKLNPI